MADVKKCSYKYCIVPMCVSTTVKNPNKNFFRVPTNELTRKKWCQVMRRDLIALRSTKYVCEDHFDVENDAENLVKYRLVGGSLKLKHDVCPHKFDCQQTNKKRRRITCHENQLTKETNKKRRSITYCNKRQLANEANKKRRQIKCNDKQLAKEIPSTSSLEPSNHSPTLQTSEKTETFEFITLHTTQQEIDDTAAGGSECSQELHIPEGKEVIVRVYRYLQTEYEQLKQLTGHSCDLSPLANILKRTAAATGVSEHTVTSLLKHDQPSDEETSDDDADAKRPRLDIDLDDDVDQKEHVGQEQIETQTEQEHYGQKEQHNYNISETLTIKYEYDDEEMEHNPLEQSNQEQTRQEQTDQEQTHQEQYRATGEQIQDGVKIKQEKDDESVKCEPADQQPSETDPLSLD